MWEECGAQLLEEAIVDYVKQVHIKAQGRGVKGLTMSLQIEDIQSRRTYNRETFL